MSEIIILANALLGICNFGKKKKLIYAIFKNKFRYLVNIKLYHIIRN